MTNILTNISDETCRNGSRVVADDNPKAAVLGRTLDDATASSTKIKKGKK